MKTIPYANLPIQEQELLRQTVKRLPRSLNKVTNPYTGAVAVTEKNYYFGNDIFLSNDTLICAEAAAMASAVAAGDYKFTKLCLAIGRTDSEPRIVSPCGNCRQWLHDFARPNGRVIEVLSVTSMLNNVMITDSDELLPEGFKSAGLGKMAGES
ncbi:MAG TPA: hypothetical protein VFZ58_04340 [Candidatus Saccharimonadales bacterium]